MKRPYLEFLCYPDCKGELVITSFSEHYNEKIKSGVLKCVKCDYEFKIRNFIPRFSYSTHYADSFGNQWKAFAKAQLDNGDTKESEIRFKSEMGWNEPELSKKTVVEFGSGAGRFIDVVSKASVNLAVGVDATDAVDAAQENLGDRENLFLSRLTFSNCQSIHLRLILFTQLGYCIILLTQKVLLI